MIKSDEQLSLFFAERQEVLFAYRHGSSLDQEYFNDIDVAVFLDEKTLATLWMRKKVWNMSSAIKSITGTS